MPTFKKLPLKGVDSVSALLDREGISPTSERQYVIWNHDTHGTLISTYEEYRQQCGCAITDDDLTFIVPALDSYE